MFEGRFAELLVIFVLALVILGPEKLPKVVADLGRWIGRARAMARQFRDQLEEEVRFEEERKAVRAQPSPPPAAPAPAPVDVATALNPHTEVSPIDVTGLPAELAQAAQPPLASEVAPPADAPAAEPSPVTEPSAAAPQEAPVAHVEPHAGPHPEPIREGQPT